MSDAIISNIKAEFNSLIKSLEKRFEKASKSIKGLELQQKFNNFGQNQLPIEDKGEGGNQFTAYKIRKEEITKEIGRLNLLREKIKEQIKHLQYIEEAILQMEKNFREYAMQNKLAAEELEKNFREFCLNLEEIAKASLMNTLNSRVNKSEETIMAIRGIRQAIKSFHAEAQGIIDDIDLQQENISNQVADLEEIKKLAKEYPELVAKLDEVIGLTKDISELETIKEMMQSILKEDNSELDKVLNEKEYDAKAERYIAKLLQKQINLDPEKAKQFANGDFSKLISELSQADISDLNIQALMEKLQETKEEVVGVTQKVDYAAEDRKILESCRDEIIQCQIDLQSFRGKLKQLDEGRANLISLAKEAAKQGDFDKVNTCVGDIKRLNNSKADLVKKCADINLRNNAAKADIVKLRINHKNENIENTTSPKPAEPTTGYQKENKKSRFYSPKYDQEKQETDPLTEMAEKAKNDQQSNKKDDRNRPKI